MSWICAIVSWVGERGGAVYLLFPLLFHTISQGIVSFPDGQEETHFIAEGEERGRTRTPRRLFKKHTSAITNSVACQRARKNLSARRDARAALLHYLFSPQGHRHRGPRAPPHSPNIRTAGTPHLRLRNPTITNARVMSIGHSAPANGHQRHAGASTFLHPSRSPLSDGRDAEDEP